MFWLGRWETQRKERNLRFPLKGNWEFIFILEINKFFKTAPKNICWNIMYEFSKSSSTHNNWKQSYSMLQNALFHFCYQAGLKILNLCLSLFSSLFFHRKQERFTIKKIVQLDMLAASRIIYEYISRRWSGEYPPNFLFSLENQMVDFIFIGNSTTDTYIEEQLKTTLWDSITVYATVVCPFHSITMMFSYGNNH